MKIEYISRIKNKKHKININCIKRKKTVIIEIIIIIVSISTYENINNKKLLNYMKKLH